MAYPTIDAPYGLRPVSLLGGQVYAGSTRQMAIGSGHGTAIFFGDAVSMSASGTVWGTAAISTDTPVQVAGVFMGCSYVNSLGQRVYSQYYPASTTGAVDTSNAIWAYVADDPDLVMKVAIVSGTTTMSGKDRAGLVGGNVPLVNNIGSTITGDSKLAVLSTTATTTTLPLKIIDVVPDTANSSGSFTEVLVTWVSGVHMYRGAAGI
jgi:hypothetical protein